MPIFRAFVVRIFGVAIFLQECFLFLFTKGIKHTIILRGGFYGNEIFQV